jgi:predicted membrane protein
MAHRTERNILGGSILMLIGLIFLLDNLKMIPPKFSLQDWWPLILILVGLFQLVQSRCFFHFSGWFLIFLGAVFLLTVQHRFGLEWDNIWRLWPVILILLGISIIFGRHHSHGTPLAGTSAKSSESVLQEKIVLSGVHKEITSADFRGGEISVVLGSAEIDLRAAKLADANAGLTVSVVLGSVEIRIPGDWAVEMKTSAVLGSIENKTTVKPEGSSKKLAVTASSVLGSIEIGY